MLRYESGARRFRGRADDELSTSSSRITEQSTQSAGLAQRRTGVKLARREEKDEEAGRGGSQSEAVTRRRDVPRARERPRVRIPRDTPL